ncbi:hypothetical protein N431DRAFT_343974 [Stipitochalara longipes BDJ]|nr:hypothetical protein N431DRAFT_343974 [Stipitochalara longipes BDJ]
MTTTHPAELNSGVWTSWLPVTTAWPSQAVCNNEAWARVGIQADSDFWPYIYDPAYAQSVANSVTCLPPQATSWWEGGSTVSNSVTSYSLGPIVCPAAYTTYSTSIVSGTSTSVICCPTSYDFVRSLPANGGIDGVCTSALTSGQTLVYASPATNSFTSVTTTFTEPALMIAVPVEGYNFAASTTSSSSSTGTAQNTGTGTGPTNSGSAPTNTGTNTPSSGLSSGAKAGIGGGIAGLVVVLAALGAFWFFRRKRKYQAAPANELPASGQHGGAGQAYRGAFEPVKPGTLVEAEAKPMVDRYEIDTSRYKPAELAG